MEKPVDDIIFEINAHPGIEPVKLLAEFRRTHGLKPNDPIPQRLARALDGTRASAMSDCACWQCICD